MRPQPDAPSRPALFERLLAAIARRLRLRDVIHVTTLGLAIAAVIVMALRAMHVGPLSTTLAAAVTAATIAGILFVARRGGRTRRAAAAHLERVRADLHNVVVTAEELLTDDRRVPEYMRARVFAGASHAVAAIAPRQTVPFRAPVTWLLVSGVAVVIAGLAPLPRGGDAARMADPGTAERSSAGAEGDVSIDIRPPAYAGLPAVRLVNPALLDVLEGSRATITIAAPSVPRARINEAEIHFHTAAGVFTSEAVLEASGYLAVEPDSPARSRHLIPIVVRPDRAPEVRITAPAKDLRVADSAQTIPIDAAAVDDLGLAAFEIRYTKVAGTGEQFEFEEGVLPATVLKTGERAWHARAQLALAALKMSPGDALVYRAVARDRRSAAAGTSSSDTYFVEIAGPGEIPLAGFERPPDRERYVLSQAMIVLEIERLLGRERTMAREAVQDAAATIAAEQRSVRANFIFLLGGEVEDEEQEAEASAEIAEGRYENAPRRDITRATRLMTRVEQALGAVSVSSALPPAREAAQALQRAFGRSRYLLRALPNRGRIDPSRRLSADLVDASDWRRDLESSAADPAVTRARDVLRAQLALVATLNAGAADPSAARQLDDIAERLLVLAPADPSLQRAARDMTAARDAVRRGDAQSARAALFRAVVPVLAIAQRDRIDADSARHMDRLAGALAIEGRR